MRVQVNAMSEPTWSSYFLRVGGVFAIFAVAIMVTREFFPGNEGYVVIGISAFGIFALAMKELRSRKRKRAARNGHRRKKR